MERLGRTGDRELWAWEGEDTVRCGPRGCSRKGREPGGLRGLWGRGLKSWGSGWRWGKAWARVPGRRTVWNLEPDHGNMGTAVASRKDCRGDGRPGAKSAPNSSRQVSVLGAVRSFPDSVRVALGPARPGFEGCHRPAG